MKIAIVNATPALGGASLVANDLARGFVRRGHEVLFISTGPSHSRTSKEGYTLELVPAGPKSALTQFVNPVATAGLYGALKRFKPDIVHVHNVNLRTFSASSLLLSRLFPMVWTIHDVWPVCVVGSCEVIYARNRNRRCRGCEAFPPWKAALSWWLKSAAFAQISLQVVCPSSWMAQSISESPLQRQPIHIIRNGVDTRVFHKLAGARQSLGIPERAQVVAFSGGKCLEGVSPASRKGWEELRVALQTLGPRHPGLHLLYIGDEVSLPDNFPVEVTFTGPVEHNTMASIFSAADICALPTRADNAPLALLEAMACEATIVASRTGGIPEILQNNLNGLLVDARDPQQLTIALERCLDAPEARESMVARALKDIRTNLTIEHTLDQHEALFTTAIR